MQYLVENHLSIHFQGNFLVESSLENFILELQFSKSNQKLQKERVDFALGKNANHQVQLKYLKSSEPLNSEVEEF